MYFDLKALKVGQGEVFKREVRAKRQGKVRSWRRPVQRTDKAIQCTVKFKKDKKKQGGSLFALAFCGVEKG